MSSYYRESGPGRKTLKNVWKGIESVSCRGSSSGDAADPWYVVSTVSLSSRAILRICPHVVDQVLGHLAWFRGVMLGKLLVAGAVSGRAARTESSVAMPVQVVHGS